MWKLGPDMAVCPYLGSRTLSFLVHGSAVTGNGTRQRKLEIVRTELDRQLRNDDLCNHGHGKKPGAGHAA